MSFSYFRSRDNKLDVFRTYPNKMMLTYSFRDNFVIPKNYI